ncbi:MAG: hypothetical protein ABIU63_07110 [Chitinophagaceae bacterium]
MKKYALQFALLVAIFSLGSCAHSAYVVRERPRDVVYFRPPPPSRSHVWVSGDWVWTGGRYQWHEGRWENPRRGAHWTDGHWQNTRHGSRWIPGHWQR